MITILNNMNDIETNFLIILESKHANKNINKIVKSILIRE